MSRLDRALQTVIPEQRIFLASDQKTRFIRLRPSTQVAAGVLAIALTGWTLGSTALIASQELSPSIPAENASGSIAHAQIVELGEERDAREREALEAQSRFAVALSEMSRLQSELVAAQGREAALEIAVAQLQGDLSGARARQAELAEAASQGGVAPTDLAALDILGDELRLVAQAREEAQRAATTNAARAAKAEEEHEVLATRTDEVLSQIEEMVSASIMPFEDIFDKIGMDPERLLSTIEGGFSGQGGPITPIAVSARNADIAALEGRAQEVVISLDRVNRYRIAASRLPLIMPVAGDYRFTSPFGPRWGRMHNGIDLAGPVGTPIISAADGEVIFAGRQSGYGNVIKLRHAMGTETRYGHLNRIHVKVGQKVSQGQRIGDMGNTGRSTGPHLHYEIRVDGKAINPMTFIKAAQNVQ